jgi:hypothetical protein
MILSRLIPLFFLLAAAGLFFGYTQPTRSGSVAEHEYELSQLTVALDAARQFADKEEVLTRERAAIAPEQIARLEAFLPDAVDNVQLIVDLNALAARSGITLSGFDILGSPASQEAPDETLALEGAEPTDSIDLSVAAEGTYASFRTFLAGVEQSLRPLDIVELSVEDSDTGVYSYDITFRIYWLK